MAYEVEVKISSAKDLKNVNWRHGDLKPYAVVWVDPSAKCSTKVDEVGDTSPIWDETLVIPLRAPIEDSTLFIDIVHYDPAPDTKPLIGSAKVPLREVVDDVGVGRPSDLKLKLKRPSGRPQGKVEARVTVREAGYRAPPPHYAPPYGIPPPPASSREYEYGAPGGPQYNYAPYGSRYPTEAPPVQAGYAYQGQYGGYGSNYGANYGSYQGEPPKKERKYGMGTGLAVGAVAGVLGGLALAEGADYVEDKIAEEAAEKVEEDLGFDDDGGDFD
ncbi:hypothetical protein Tsubulata_026890 [Turnera subulata]|uniref:C2 domain-containing protein n=1 Tax=Turnera subulata TaxID=218843 RepID=A0A9Q0FMR1_9ROSI|nr:hypothetical protein Tsubulata_026890 [Turnera subulata]